MTSPFLSYLLWLLVVPRLPPLATNPRVHDLAGWWTGRRKLPRNKKKSGFRDLSLGLCSLKTSPLLPVSVQSHGLLLSLYHHLWLWTRVKLTHPACCLTPSLFSYSPLKGTESHSITACFYFIALLVYKYCVVNSSCYAPSSLPLLPASPFQSVLMPHSPIKFNFAGELF